jgi:bifunctional non-homologous end joining protein LigD
MNRQYSHYQEFVICGMTARAGYTGEVGSFLIGYYAGDTLHQTGSVGTGWSAKTAPDLWKRLVRFA